MYLNQYEVLGDPILSLWHFRNQEMNIWQDVLHFQHFLAKIEVVDHEVSKKQKQVYPDLQRYRMAL